jgi:glutathione synthase/RimK-type ligase-like ATP-grasp enzyme
VILLWGIATDDPLAEVGAALDLNRSPYVFVDQMAILETDVELLVNGSVTGRISIRGEGIALENVRAAYLRPYDSGRIPAVERAADEGGVRRRAAAVDEGLLVWAELTPALVVNLPSAMASNGSKPYQSALIQSQGFRVPPTLITTDPEAALDFWERYGSVVYKSLSSARSIVSRLSPTRARDLDDVSTCPTQFQAYVPGRDYRVHVVGKEVFVSEVESAAVDYRYAGRDGHSVSIRAAGLPPGLDDRCRDLAAFLGLSVAGIDLRMTPDGEWYCFEVNPSPGFTFYEEATGQPIAEAVAWLLADADRSEGI